MAPTQLCRALLAWLKDHATGSAAAGAAGAGALDGPLAQWAAATRLALVATSAAWAYSEFVAKDLYPFLTDPAHSPEQLAAALDAMGTGRQAG